MSLAMAGVLELGDLQGPCQAKPSYDSMILWFCDLTFFFYLEMGIII